jgi:CBS domain-containing protein
MTSFAGIRPTEGVADGMVPRDIRLTKEQLMNIREVMTPNPQSVSPGDTIQNAARIMRDYDTGAVPVVDNGRPVGILTDRDIVVRAVAEGGQLNRTVREIVSGDIICVSPDMSTHEAADLMSEHQIRRLPVIENDRLVGIVSLGDLAVKEAKDKRSGDTLEHISEGVKERG